MSRSGTLVFVALCIFAVHCKPLETQNAASLQDPKLQAAFLEFLKNQNNMAVAPAIPTQVQPEILLPVTQAPLAIIPTVVVPQPKPTVPLQVFNPGQFTPQVNSSIQQWGNVRIVTPPRANVVPVPDLLTPEQRRKQAEGAQFQFSTYEDDNIKGSFLSRAEVRKGLKVSGQYEYDDGHVHRKVFYEADENGFRIVKEETTPSIKTGNLDGTAKVQILLDGTQVDYAIASKDDGVQKRVLVPI